MDLALVDRVATETLGFPITHRAQQVHKVNQNSLVSKLVRQTSWQSRRAFVTKLHQAHDPYASIASRVRTAEIGRTPGPNEPLTEADIVKMVRNFLLAMRRHAQVVTVLKRLLLHDLTVRLEDFSSTFYVRKGSRCTLANLQKGLLRLTRETFLLRYRVVVVVFTFIFLLLLLLFSFNGSRYDAPLLLPYVYKCLATKQDFDYKCSIQVFYRGTVVNSGKPFLKSFFKFKKKKPP